MSQARDCLGFFRERARRPGPRMAVGHLV